MLKNIGLMATLILFSAIAWQTSAPVAAQVRNELRPLPDDPAATDADRGFMKRAYEIARNAAAHGSEPFAAVLVRDGKIVAEFENVVKKTGDVTKHAETGLISDVCTRINRGAFRGSTLYASTEPCTMCCGAIRWAGIERVVFGVSESQVDQIIAAHFGDTPAANALYSKEVFRRTAPGTKIIGPVGEAEGLTTHAEFWPKFLSRQKQQGEGK
jgi:tRNA(Arg) A34 adenosine deaminase TadA